MADTFLSPQGDYSDIASFCGVKGSAGGGFATDNHDFVRAVAAAVAAVRTRCGPVLLEEGLSFRVRAATHTAMLPYRVAAVTAVVPADGSTMDAATLDPDGQLVARTDGLPVPVCTLTYSSGWAHGDIPADLVAAGFELARHLWRTQLGNQRAGGDPGEAPGSAWLWPRQAESLAAPYALAPLGFA